ncbi:MAG TPA: hypothetical protein PLV13_08360, partial [Ilumatobacteraceae bacterium]|nr:hypothetical protein [Ilumatobacteraceae bacterium]
LLPTSADAAAAERALTPADAYPWPADGSDAGAGTSSGGSGASDSADVGAAMMGAPGSSGGYATRFIDLCAEVPDSTLCPTGVGGTVLVPFEGDVDFGTFDVFGIYGTPSPFWRCDLPASLETNEYPVLVNATHPARIEIEYHPVDDPTDSQHAVVDLTDLAGEAYQEFSRYFGEHGTVPVEGVHHCFVLHASADFRSYEVTAVGTSFTGDTDTMVSRVDFNPRRPAVIVTPSTDDPLKATIGVPVAVDPTEWAIVRMLRVADGQTCPDVEDEVVSGESTLVVPAPGSGRHLERIVWSDTFVPAPPGWATDVYDVDAWSVSLEESTDYLMCVWWVTVPEHSYDPRYMSITERENRLISTPDMRRTRIYVDGTQAGNSALAAGSVSVVVPNGCHANSGASAELHMPTVPLLANQAEYFAAGRQVCEYPGISQPDTTRLVVTGPGMTPKSFDLPTPLVADSEIDTYYLYFGDSGCLQGVSFGIVTGNCDSVERCTPRTECSTDHPDLLVTVWTIRGASNGLDDWLITDGHEFASPERPPAALPAEIQLDYFNSGVEAAGRNAVQVTANFDRPVTLQASLEGDPCVIGAVPSYTSATPSATHTFVLDGLCTLTTYGVRLEASDGTTTTVFSDFARQWDGHAQTDGYHVSYTVEVGERADGWNELLYAHWGIHIDVPTVGAFGVPTSLRGEPVPVGAPSRCLEPSASAPQEAVWGDTVDVVVQARLQSAVLAGRGYCSRRTERGYADLWADVVASIPIEELQAGPVHVTVPFADDPEFSITLTIRSTFSE